MKYIDADRLKVEIERLKDKYPSWQLKLAMDDLCDFITSLQQDKETLDLCSQSWWEEQGWIMIPPNVTLKGIESLLERVRNKIKWNEENGIEEQEQSDVDLEKEIDRVFFQQDCGSNRLYYKEIANLAHHFAEWGATHLNARKEE